MKIVNYISIIPVAIFIWFMMFIGIGFMIGMITEGITFTTETCMTIIAITSGISGGLTVKILDEM